MDYSPGQRPEWGAQFSPGQSGSCSTLHDAQVTLACLGKNPKGPAIHDFFRKEWEAALEAKRTVSASNRKVGLTSEQDLIIEARIFRNLQL